MTEFAVESVDALREIYPAPKGTPVKKTLYALDEHCRNFIAHSPILMLGTDGDVSPRGDDPGFVTVADDNTLIIPDRKGNFRVDSMQNILRNSTIGILFLVPGMEVTLRIRGKAAITVDPEILEPLAINGKEPASAIVVHVEEAFLHCGKALIRADIWNPEARIADGTFPPPGRMYADHMNADRDVMEKHYAEHIEEDLAEEGRTVPMAGS
ncbi:MAG: pyridoxamine 5'-phosphate oxidase family protein [Rhodospirillales bacterium]|jgi:hypothetical protein|nr:pyridoxamine 5'-phosphate oxidase [Rhodospirillaceae bacterium]MDP6429001.1 pyridoxamine 5'-phosphate oxidase family protein [Rhodospirillales bacterium]MDP6646722.1 pyridoxamine 5'-phosphate oxidase family protein [Rhodospirillales bacterium]MDP6840579.1 pyridoxamine 5'-phosphate oxidase family protein [Rhodospirillales bacterium]|tara:strand:+ start:802 stop:1434 length:633 start_codon:yes stop_codon:yes gene_type:complete